MKSINKAIYIYAYNLTDMVFLTFMENQYVQSQQAAIQITKTVS